MENPFSSLPYKGFKKSHEIPISVNSEAEEDVVEG